MCLGQQRRSLPCSFPLLLWLMLWKAQSKVSSWHTREISFFFCELFTRCFSVVKIKSSSRLTQHTCCRICRKLVSDVISKPRKIKKIKAFTATYIHIIMCKWILRLSFKWAAESHKISSTNHLVLLNKNCQIVSSSVSIFLLQSSAPLKIEYLSRNKLCLLWWWGQIEFFHNNS